MCYVIRSYQYFMVAVRGSQDVYDEGQSEVDVRKGSKEKRENDTFGVPSIFETNSDIVP